jgi:ABC-2 type transport system permease protein
VAAATFSSVLVAGVIATAIIFQGIQAVALPLVQEFGYTKEIEDRVLAPLPVSVVALEKITAGALQCLLAGLVVFPIAAIVPATAVHLKVNWLVVLTLVPLGCLMSSALGLMFGTMFDPRTVPMLFGVILIPITFLGCTYYSWEALRAIRWLQIAVLLNPLVYLSEGFRAALTPVPHMSLIAVYGVTAALTTMFGWVGIRGFTRRVIA